MNPEEQPKPEQPETDLFKWAQENPKPQQKQAPKFVYATSDDGLGYACRFCDEGDGYCPRHPRPKNEAQKVESEIDSSIRIVEHEAEIADAENKLKEPASPEELEAFFEDTKNKLAS